MAGETAAPGARPRVLFVNSGLLGQKTFASYVAQEFVGKGDVDATQIVLTESLTLDERIARFVMCARLWRDGWLGLRNLDLLRYRAEMSGGLRARARIAALERAGQRFEVLHFHHQATAYGSLDRVRRTPTILSIDCTQGLVRARATSAIERASYAPNVAYDGRLFAAADCIVSPSQWAAESVRREYPACATPVVVLPLAVRLDAFDPAWAAARDHRAATPGYRPRVLFVGGDFPRKGGFDLLAAWQSGGFAGRATLDLVTNWPLGALPDGVAVHRNVEAYTTRWRDLWREADLFVMPTRDEAFGIVFQEAGAAGLPAIGTRLNAIPEMIDEGTSGLLVPPGDRTALVQAIDVMLAAPERRAAMGRAARQQTERRCNPVEYRRRLLDIVRTLAATGKAAPRAGV